MLFHHALQNLLCFLLTYVEISFGAPSITRFSFYFLLILWESWMIELPNAMAFFLLSTISFFGSNIICQPNATEVYSIFSPASFIFPSAWIYLRAICICLPPHNFSLWNLHSFLLFGPLFQFHFNIGESLIATYYNLQGFSPLTCGL